MPHFTSAAGLLSIMAALTAAAAPRSAHRASPAPAAPRATNAPGVGHAPPALLGTRPDADAWAIVHAGQLWVCWEARDDCFRPVGAPGASPWWRPSDDPTDDPDDDDWAASTTRLDAEPGLDLDRGLSGRFVDDDRLLLRDAAGHAAMVVRGHWGMDAADPAADAGLGGDLLDAFRIYRCRDEGLVPRIVAGRPVLAAVSCRARPGSSCPRLRTRGARGAGIELAAGVEVARQRIDAIAGPTGALEQTRGWELSLVITAFFDGVTARARRHEVQAFEVERRGRCAALESGR